jgi:sigma-E factor negative regulatory protein RseC
MIEDTGKVVRVVSDKAFVEVERTSACAQCGLQEVEEMTGGRPIFVAMNMAKANVGDIVSIRVESVAYIKASAFIYGIPILFLIIGAVIGIYLDGKFGISSDTLSAMLGMAGLIIGIVVLFIFRRKGGKKNICP